MQCMIGMIMVEIVTSQPIHQITLSDQNGDVGENVARQTTDEIKILTTSLYNSDIHTYIVYQ